MASSLAQANSGNSDYLAERDRAWPFGGSLSETAADLLLIAFFVGASGIMLPFDLGPIQPLQRLVWSIADIAAVIFVLFHRDLLFALARKNAPILVWPALAIVSTVWSVVPAATFYFAIQLVMTMLVGFMIASYASLTRLLQCFFVAITITSALSLVAVFVYPEFALYDATAWKGLFLHKNVLGMTMALQIILGICLLLHGWRPIFTICSLLLSVGLLVKSASASSVVVLMVALLPIPIIVGMRDRQNRMMAVLGVGLIIASLALLLLFLEDLGLDPIEAALGGLGKEKTLTGRTLIWDFGWEAYYERPWLGYGFKAYWKSTETTAGLLRYITNWPLGHFHSSFLEVMVAFGVLGPPVLIGTLAYAGILSVRTYNANPTFINLWPIVYLAAVVMLSFSENPLFNNHGMAEILLIAIITNGGVRGWVRS